MKTAHTPTPWHTEEECYDSDQIVILILGSENGFVAECRSIPEGTKDDDETARNEARFIVHAVNNHDALVEQCELFERTILYEIKNAKDEKGKRMKTVTLNLLREVLAAARGNKGNKV